MDRCIELIDKSGEVLVQGPQETEKGGRVGRLRRTGTLAEGTACTKRQGAVRKPGDFWKL